MTKRTVLASLIVALLFMGIWYFFAEHASDLVIQEYANDDAAIAVLTQEATKQEIWSAIDHFESSLDHTKENPRSYSYYAAALSMRALHLPDPLDKQSSSTEASVVFTDVKESYPEQALSVVFEAITLLRSPEFLELGEKSRDRLATAWEKIESDNNDGKLSDINVEALDILIQFLPMFENTYKKSNLINDAFIELKQVAEALNSTIKI